MQLMLMLLYRFVFVVVFFVFVVVFWTERPVQTYRPRSDATDNTVSSIDTRMPLIRTDGKYGKNSQGPVVQS